MSRWQALPARSRALGVLLGVSLLATLWAASQTSPEADDDAVALAPRAAAQRAAPRPASVSGGMSGAVTAPAATWPEPPAVRAPWPRIAQASAWGPPPVPQAPVVQAQRAAVPQAEAASGPQSAPPFPYTLIGRLEDGPLTQALLASPRRTLGVKPQDVIDGQWRVDRVDAAGVTLTWLPGGQALTLALRPS